MLNAPVETASKLDRNVQLRIGQGLRRMYDGLATTPVPDRLLELLAKPDAETPRVTVRPPP
jgi:hypothetical protein